MILEFFLRQLARIPPGSWIQRSAARQAALANTTPWMHPFTRISFSTVCGAVDGTALGVVPGLIMGVLSFTEVLDTTGGHLGSSMLLLPSMFAAVVPILIGKFLGGLYGFGRGLWRVKKDGEQDSHLIHFQKQE